MIARIIASILERNFQAITSPRGFRLFIGGFLAICFVLRLTLFPGASQDDSEMLVLAQSFEGLYKPGQPPLLTWLYVALFELTGPSLLVVVLVKSLALAATYLFLHLAALRLIADPRHAALAAAAPVMIFLVSFDALFNYSNTVVMALAVAALLWLATRLRDGGRLADYAAFGLVLGLGVLAKYNLAIFAAGLAAAGLYDPALRARFLHRRMLLALAVAAAIVAPHGVWMVANREIVAQAFAAAFQGAGSAGWLADAASGLFQLGDGLVGFFLPMSLFFIVLFPRACLPIRGAIRGPIRGSPARTNERFLLVLGLTIIALLVAAVLFAGVNYFRNHYFFIFIYAPIWFFVRLESVPPAKIAYLRCAALTSVSALLVILGVIGKFAVEPSLCKRCNVHIPYPELAAQIRAAGFVRGTILLRGQFVQIGGNIRIEFPEARVVPYRFRYSYRPPRQAPEGQCMLLWDPDVPPDDVDNLRAYARREFGATFSAASPVRIAEAPLGRASGRRYRLSFMLLAEGQGDCR